MNNQKLSYQLNESKIPISKNLLSLIKNYKYKRLNLVSNGDDYQVLFTAKTSMSRIINKTSKALGIKITKIGKINSANKENTIIDEKGKEILIKNKGYIHKF